MLGVHDDLHVQRALGQDVFDRCRGREDVCEMLAQIAQTHKTKLDQTPENIVPLKTFHPTFQFDPQVVGVEELEGLDGREVVDVLLGHLGDFQQPQLVLVLDEGASLRGDERAA